MLKIRQYGDVTQFLMGTEYDGQVLYWCACYLLDDLLIDTGSPRCAAELCQALEGRGVRRAVNTHHHEDHIGANALLQSEMDVQIFAPRAALGLIEHGFPLKHYQQVVWGEPEPSRPLPLGETVLTLNHCLEVIPTPGHCPDHVVLLDGRTGWAFTGDAYFGPDPKTARADEDFGGALASLELLYQKRPTVMFTGLGDIVENATDALGKCIENVRGRAAEIAELARSGLGTAEIVGRLHGRESSLHGLTDGHLSYASFVRAFAEAENNAV